MLPPDGWSAGGVRRWVLGPGALALGAGLAALVGPMTRAQSGPAVSALAWYERHAPPALAPPVDWPAAAHTLTVRGLAPPGALPTPVVADLALADLDGDARLELIVCDMRHGMVLLGRPYDPDARWDAPPPARGAGGGRLRRGW